MAAIEAMLEAELPADPVEDEGPPESQAPVDEYEDLPDVVTVTFRGTPTHMRAALGGLQSRFRHDSGTITMVPAQESALRRLSAVIREGLDDFEAEQRRVRMRARPKMIQPVLERRDQGGVTDPNLGADEDLGWSWNYANERYRDPHAWLEHVKGDIEGRGFDAVGINPRTFDSWVNGERAPSVESMVSADFAMYADTVGGPIHTLYGVVQARYTNERYPQILADIMEDFDLSLKLLARRSGISLRRLQSVLEDRSAKNLTLLEVMAVDEALHEILGG